MYKLTIEIEGKTTDDLLYALDEVRSKVEQEYGSGFDSNDSGRYKFDVSGEEEPSTRFSIGDKVIVASSNDNENYDDFRDKTLIVTHVATSTDEHPGYDDSMGGMALYDLRTEDGEAIGSSLYEYELEEA